MPSNKLKVAPGQKRLGTTVQVVSRERCVFHVDRVWTSTRGEGVRPMWTGEGGQKRDFFVNINGWPLINPIVTLRIPCILVSVTENVRVLIIHAAVSIDFILIRIVLTIRQIKELILVCTCRPTTVSATLALQQLFGHLSFSAFRTV